MSKSFIITCVTCLNSFQGQVPVSFAFDRNNNNEFICPFCLNTFPLENSIIEQLLTFNYSIKLRDNIVSLLSSDLNVHTHLDMLMTIENNVYSNEHLSFISQVLKSINPNEWAIDLQ